MEIIRQILQDIRKRQNLDIYITIALAIVVSFLGFAQVTDQATISSAVLAILALVSFSLQMNRRENEEIQKALSRTENIRELIENLSSSLGVTFTFVGVREGEGGGVPMQRIRKLVVEPII